MIYLLGILLALLGIGYPALLVWRGYKRLKMRKELADIICEAFYRMR